MECLFGNSRAMPFSSASSANPFFGQGSNIGKLLPFNHSQLGSPRSVYSGFARMIIVVLAHHGPCRSCAIDSKHSRLASFAETPRMTGSSRLFGLPRLLSLQLLSSFQWHGLIVKRTHTLYPCTAECRVLLRVQMVNILVPR
jgi:hypothetical protein